MKKRKWIIILSVVVGIIGLFVLLSFTLFGLHSIEVDFRTSTQNLSETQVLESVSLKKNCPVYFQSKKKCIKKIEEALPYADVVNIETVFPSKMIIHNAERVEVYAVEGEDETYICDDELRVLRKEEEFTSTPQNAMLLNMEEELTKKYEEGEYIEGKVPSIYQNFYSINRGIGEQKELIESITQSKEYDGDLKEYVGVLTLNLFSGQKVKFYDETFMKEKVKLFIDVYSQLFNYIGMSLKVGEGQYVQLTEEDLKNCTIVVKNRLLPDQNSGQNCYFDILLNE